MSGHMEQLHGGYNNATVSVCHIGGNPGNGNENYYSRGHNGHRNEYHPSPGSNMNQYGGGLGNNNGRGGASGGDGVGRRVCTFQVHLLNGEQELKVCHVVHVRDNRDPSLDSISKLS